MKTILATILLLTSTNLVRADYAGARNLKTTNGIIIGVQFSTFSNPITNSAALRIYQADQWANLLNVGASNLIVDCNWIVGSNVLREMTSQEKVERDGAYYTITTNVIDNLAAQPKAWPIMTNNLAISIAGGYSTNFGTYPFTESWGLSCWNAWDTFTKTSNPTPPQGTINYALSMYQTYQLLFMIYPNGLFTNRYTTNIVTSVTPTVLQ